jgi:hypothetical protein
MGVLVSALIAPRACTTTVRVIETTLSLRGCACQGKTYRPGVIGANQLLWIVTWPGQSHCCQHGPGRVALVPHHALHLTTRSETAPGRIRPTAMEAVDRANRWAVGEPTRTGHPRSVPVLGARIRAT